MELADEAIHRPLIAVAAGHHDHHLSGGDLRHRVRRTTTHPLERGLPGRWTTTSTVAGMDDPSGNLVWSGNVAGGGR